MSAWLNQHLHALQIAGRRLFAHPVGSLFTILVIGLVASLPAFAYLVVNNIASLAGKLDPEPKLSIYLKPTAGDPEVTAVKERLSATPNIADSRFVSKDAALACEFRRMSGHDSGACRSNIPADAGPRFRLMSGH